MSPYRNWLSLCEIDRQAGTAKGAAFRCFKRLERGLREGVDYCLLHAERDREVIDQLRQCGRIYAGSVNVVLLAPETARCLVDVLSAPSPDDR